jgi:hypothetical protein
MDIKLITKHHHTKERKTHTKALLCCCFFLFFLLFYFLFFDIFFRGTSKLNSRTKMLLMSNWPHTLFLERVGEKR